MEQAKAGTNDKITLRPKTIGSTQPGVEVLPLGIEHATRPGLPLPANPTVQSQTARGTPFVLNEKAIIRVVESAFRLIADCRRNLCPAINRRIQALLIEIGRLESLKKDYVWV